ncbi:hypothetical protein BYT27DRAFT_7227904 [Phlegmacium glaucopus]|nr:hypothetical protein BYT27DRAFT_7227904 [Phlegmacium glaucopus]
MANLLRTAKSGSDWSQIELYAYNIVVELQDAATFFGVNPLPQPAVASELMNNVAAEDMVNDANYKLLRYMDLATNPVPAEESAVDDFAVHLLTLLDYVPRTRMTRTRADIRLVICGQECHAKTDVCIVDSDNILLLVQEDKRHKEPKDPEPQLIANAIAAFQTNNYRRTRVLGQESILHKVPVTTQLAQSVALGLYPTTPTVVHAYLPEIARPDRRLSEGMKPLDNRATILASYEAFKMFVNY